MEKQRNDKVYSVLKFCRKAADTLTGEFYIELWRAYKSTDGMDLDALFARMSGVDLADRIHHIIINNHLVLSGEWCGPE